MYDKVPTEIIQNNMFLLKLKMETTLFNNDLLRLVIFGISKYRFGLSFPIMI